MVLGYGRGAREVESGEALIDTASVLEGLARESGGGLLRAVIESLPDNLMVLDRDGLIRYINWTVPDLTVEQVLGTSPTAYVPVEYQSTTLACFERVFATGQPDRYEVHYVAADGGVSFWESRVSPVRGPGGIDGLAIVSSNITARTEAAAERDLFFNVSLDLLCVATPSGYFKRVNPAFVNALGWSEHELTAVAFREFVHPDDRASTDARLADLAAGVAVVDFENRYRCKDGSYRLLQWRGIASPGSDLIFGAGRDVTERRALETALQQSQKMDAIGQLAGGVAHDFNNLLLAIGMNTALAKQRATDPEGLVALEQALEAVERATNLTRQLLTFSREEPLAIEEVDLADRLRSLETMLRSMLREDITFRIDVPDGLPRVCVDPAQVDLVILNLCLNARDALTGAGSIELAGREARVAEPTAAALSIPPARYAVISVTDDGTGIAPEARDHLFEPFFTTKPRGKGTGLGLSTAYAVIRRHGGAIRVESEPGAGATFEVYLPVVHSSAERTAVPAWAPCAGGTETVLLAEDSELVRSGVIRLLESHGYRVIPARDGVEAVERARENADAIDVALLDVIMPRMGGIQAGREIAELCPRAVVRYTTGHGGDTFERVEIPANQVLAKPYAPEALLLLLREALDLDQARRQ